MGFCFWFSFTISVFMTFFRCTCCFCSFSLCLQKWIQWSRNDCELAHHNCVFLVFIFFYVSTCIPYFNFGANKALLFNNTKFYTKIPNPKWIEATKQNTEPHYNKAMTKTVTVFVCFTSIFTLVDSISCINVIYDKTRRCKSLICRMRAAFQNWKFFEYCRRSECYES